MMHSRFDSLERQKTIWDRRNKQSSAGPENAKIVRLEIEVESSIVGKIMTNKPQLSRLLAL